MTAPRGTDNDNATAPAWRRPAGARQPRPAHPTDAPAHETPARGTAPALDRPRFDTVVRGYDRVEVDTYVGRVDQVVTQLRSELADADGRRRRAEQRIETLEGENRAARSRLEAAAAPPEEGFGVRAEKLLRLAEQEAAEVRSGAAEEAAVLRQQVREDVERQRHVAEQALIARSAQFDEHASRRTGELQRREQQVAEQLTAARGEAEAVQSAARRAADQYRQRVEADVEQIKARVNAEVAQIREQSAQELDRLAALESGVRNELLRLSTRLTQEIAHRAGDGRGAGTTADSETTADGEPGDAAARTGAAAGGAAATGAGVQR